ncbi:MAG: hypothetical protein ONA90_01710 [candidate division KSB1 bacterium]|nr:hypothetical protein [candidate division KSB1 bacterium]
MFEESFLPFIAKISPTVMWIALTIGLLLYVVGYFAGAKLTLGRIAMCVIIVTIISILALPIPMTILRIAKEQANIKIVSISIPGEKTAATANDKQSPTPSQTKPAAESKSGTFQYDEKVPTSLQMLAFVLYIVWVGFLVAMGIFLYETWTVTAEEAETRYK